MSLGGPQPIVLTKMEPPPTSMSPGLMMMPTVLTDEGLSSSSGPPSPMQQHMNHSTYLDISDSNQRLVEFSSLHSILFLEDFRKILQAKVYQQDWFSKFYLNFSIHFLIYLKEDSQR